MSEIEIDDADLEGGMDEFQVKKVKSALKLQKLVKERTDELFPVSSASDDYNEAMVLQSLVEESEK